MYPMIRLATCLLRARRSPAIAPGDTIEAHFVARPWDMDVFFEMNNGRHLTLFDMGRFEYSARCGLWRNVKRKGWGFAVGGASVRYRRRIRMFDRVTTFTTLLGRDARWFYFNQSHMVRGVVCSSTLARTAVTGEDGIVPTQTVAEAMGAPDWNPPLPDWVQDWTRADAVRPWPPAHAETVVTDAPPAA